MPMSTWACRNPVPPIALFILLCVLGLFRFRNLAIAQFPHIDLPIVTVSVTQVGAADKAKAALADLETRYPDTAFSLIDDATPHTAGNYNSAMETLYEGAILAVIVVLLFLRNWRATIIMTTIAIMAGMPPSALAFGDGGEFRAPMAIAVIGGLLLSTLLSLVFVPALFSTFDELRGRMRRGLVTVLGANG